MTIRPLSQPTIANGCAPAAVAVAAWIDLNAVCYGVYGPADQARQARRARGEPVPLPEIQ